jgi:hypothetical protein
VIELASGEYGQDNVDKMVKGSENGRSLTWFIPPDSLRDSKTKGMDIQALVFDVANTIRRHVSFISCLLTTQLYHDYYRTLACDAMYFIDLFTV